MAKLFANSGDPDQTPHSVASDLGLHCLPITLLRVSRLQWINDDRVIMKQHSSYRVEFCLPLGLSMEPQDLVGSNNCSAAQTLDFAIS